MKLKFALPKFASPGPGPHPVGFRDHLLGLGIGTVYVAWLLATARSLGFARDEGFYFRAAGEYARWFRLLFQRPGEAIERGAIDGIWATNHEHPALMKSLFSLSWMFFHEKWKIFSDASTAFRFPGMVMAGLALWITYVFGARAYSRRAGILAALALGLMPNIFYHAHLAAFDVAIMTMWTACVYVYWRAEQQGGLGWALGAGLVYGLTLETKHNAWMLPAVFLVHAAFLHRRRLARQIRVGRVGLPASLLAMATVGPLVFYALWPWLWNDTLPRIQEYLNFHLNHEYYNMEFLGVNYFGPPSPKGYAPVMILATVPTITLLLFAIGAVDRLRHGALRARAWLAPILKRRKAAAAEETPTRAPRDPGDKHETDLLLFLSLAVPLAVFFLPKTPIFGGTKHWIPAYPFLAIFAGRGLDLVARQMEHALRATGARARRFANVALLLAVLAGPLAVTAHSHPFGLSTYVPLVGGTAGGADLGLNRQFWGFTTQSLAPYFAAKAPRNASVFIHDTAWDSWSQMLAEHRLRPDLRGTGTPSDADFSIVHHELHMAELDYIIWAAYGSPQPDYVLTHDGVPIVSVYRKR